MPGVAVRATHEATNGVTAAVTDSAGLYVLRNLPVGRYAVVAELAGFQTSREHRHRRPRQRGRPASTPR